MKRRLFLAGVGLLLVAGAYFKLADPRDFAKALRGYGVFRENWLPFLLPTVPALEGLVGCLLVASRSRGALLWALCLFSGFVALLGWGWWRGLAFTCGCFGPWDSWLHRQRFGLELHLLGNLLILGGLGYCWRRPA